MLAEVLLCEVKMKWFKHYSNASNDNSINRLEDEFGHFGYAAYWKILEVCADKWDGKSEPKFVLNKSMVVIMLRSRRHHVTKMMTLLHDVELFRISENDHEYIVEIPNLLKIKDNHAKNEQAKINSLASNLPQEQNRTDKIRTDKNKRNIKEKEPNKKSEVKEIDSPLGFLFTDQPEIKKWLGTGMKEIQKQLLDTYKEDYLQETILNAYAWQAENTKRKAGTFLKAWIERDKNKKIREEADPLYKFFISQGCVPQTL